jgi:polygalacturonase
MFARSAFIAALLLAVPAFAAAPGFNVRDFGATGDGKTLESAAINKAIDAAAAAGGGTVVVPPGKYLTGTLILKSNITLEIAAGATLLGSSRREDYPMVEDAWNPQRQVMAPLLYAHDAEHVTITGTGLIDGQGEPWWLLVRPNLNAPRGGRAERGAAAPAAPPATSPARGPAAGVERPQLLRFVRCNDLVIEKVSLLNSPSWNIHPMFCDRVRVDGVSIKARVPSPNTDGINPEGCSNVQISNCRIDVGDDCVTLKSGTENTIGFVKRPEQDITITNCVMYQGHGGVTIGSEMSGGVRNITVSNCVFHGTDNGIRVKSQRGRGGIVEGLTVSNIVMEDVPHPFIITTFYMNRNPGAIDEMPPRTEGTPLFRDFLFSNITARNAKDAGSITGLRELPIEGMMFSNVHLQADTPFTVTNAKSIRFRDVVIDTKSGPAITLRNTEDIDTSRVETRVPHADTPLVQNLGNAQAPK